MNKDKVVSARVKKDLVQNLQESTGKDVNTLVKEGFELLSQKYVDDTQNKLKEIMDLVSCAAKAILCKVDSGTATDEDHQILEFYSRVTNMCKFNKLKK